MAIRDAEKIQTQWTFSDTVNILGYFLHIIFTIYIS